MPTSLPIKTELLCDRQDNSIYWVDMNLVLTQDTEEGITQFVADIHKGRITVTSVLRVIAIDS